MTHKLVCLFPSHYKYLHSHKISLIFVNWFLSYGSSMEEKKKKKKKKKEKKMNKTLYHSPIHL